MPLILVTKKLKTQMIMNNKYRICYNSQTSDRLNLKPLPPIISLQRIHSRESVHILKTNTHKEINKFQIMNLNRLLIKTTK